MSPARVHYVAGLRTGRTVYLRGYPLCVVGDAAEVVGSHPDERTHDPEKVTCGACRRVLRRAGK